MIALLKRELPPRADSYLRQFQAEVDAVADYPERVEAAKYLWSQKTNSARATFKIVRDTLIAMNRDDPHCYYCGSSIAYEIDHFRPTSLFPEKTFVWSNYLYCCDRCNGCKSGKFALFTNETTTDITHLARTRDTPCTQPPHGSSVLIDPHLEDPSLFLLLRLAAPNAAEHCRYRPYPGIDARSRIRAEYTIETLGLNSRNYLIDGRQSSFVGYSDIFTQYVSHKSRGASQIELAHRIVAITKGRHRVVWQEMKRYYRNGWLQRLPELQSIAENFDAAPEALEW